MDSFKCQNATWQSKYCQQHTTTSSSSTTTTTTRTSSQEQEKQMNVIQSLGRSNINIAEPQGPLLIKERKHEDLEHGHHGEGEEQLRHHHSLPPPTQHPGCAQPGGGWIMFSKHIRIFLLVLILVFILILFLILILTFIQGQTPPGMSKCVLGWCLPLDYQKLESPTPDEPVIDFINFIIIITKSIAIIFHFDRQHKLELCCHCHSHNSHNNHCHQSIKESNICF